jgi:hypothetical protein
MIKKPIDRPKDISDECWYLLEGMLQIDPLKRFSAYNVLMSPVFKTSWPTMGKCLIRSVYLFIF